MSCLNLSAFDLCIIHVAASLVYDWVSSPSLLPCSVQCHRRPGRASFEGVDGGIPQRRAGKPRACKRGECRHVHVASFGAYMHIVMTSGLLVLLNLEVLYNHVFDCVFDVDHT